MITLSALAGFLTIINFYLLFVFSGRGSGMNPLSLSKSTVSALVYNHKPGRLHVFFITISNGILGFILVIGIKEKYDLEWSSLLIVCGVIFALAFLFTALTFLDFLKKYHSLGAVLFGLSIVVIKFVYAYELRYLNVNLSIFSLILVIFEITCIAAFIVLCKYKFNGIHLLLMTTFLSVWVFGVSIDLLV